MTQTEQISRLVTRTDLNRKQVDQLLKELGFAIQIALVEGDDVTLPGLGKLTAKARPGRVGRNPVTGETIAIAARNAAVFKPIKALKDAINP